MLFAERAPTRERLTEIFL
ncbi:hypothetical protein [Salmonella enterica]